MLLIAGLGNPENRYLATRHNTGFLCVDRIAARYGISVNKSEGKALTGTGMMEGVKVLLVKPQTYMNASGESLQALTSYYRIDPQAELLVIVDDIHLPPGTLRLRKGGSAGGHNGLKNIAELLGTTAFPRLRVGVGEAVAGGNLIPHVLGNFSKEEWAVMDGVIDAAADAAACFVTDGIDAAMNRFNRKAASGESAPGEETRAGD
ncbi:MAG: aminoacyl-tRNA hydrolase [Lachnospiraceae bacterium]|nr:aminoacyl-tRNA hydrolase [Lachnospiraceae bacterium]